MSLTWNLDEITFRMFSISTKTLCSKGRLADLKRKLKLTSVCLFGLWNMSSQFEHGYPSFSMTLWISSGGVFIFQWTGSNKCFLWHISQSQMSSCDRRFWGHLNVSSSNGTVTALPWGRAGAWWWRVGEEQREGWSLLTRVQVWKACMAKSNARLQRKRKTLTWICLQSQILKNHANLVEET